MQLAEKLGITDRAVSKWETGRALPDAALMLPLCEILHITVNDLLSGEEIGMENKNQKNTTILSIFWQKSAFKNCHFNALRQNG